MSTSVALTFDGQIASSGRMLLYEFGRSQYAFSRILTTVEQFRRTGEVLDRIHPSKRVDLVVKVPEKGSFKLDVEVADLAEASSLSFEQTLAIALDRLLPVSDEYEDLCVRLAVIRLAEHNRNEDTVRALSDDDAIYLQKLINGEEYFLSHVSTRLISWALHTTNRAVARADIGQDELKRAFDVIESDIKRKEIISKIDTDIDPVQIDLLAAKVRSQFKELAVPLGRCATEINIGTDGDVDNVYTLDSRRLSKIGESVLDLEEVTVSLKIKNYDVETKNGTVRERGVAGVRRFSVDALVSEEVSKKITDIMDSQQYYDFTCAKYVDLNGVFKSYIIRDIDLD